jgi:hypothetical protein
MVRLQWVKVEEARSGTCPDAIGYGTPVDMTGDVVLGRYGDSIQWGYPILTQGIRVSGSGRAKPERLEPRT